MVFFMKIGVIAIQGAVSEHVDALRRALKERRSRCRGSCDKA